MGQISKAKSGVCLAPGKGSCFDISFHPLPNPREPRGPQRCGEAPQKTVRVSACAEYRLRAEVSYTLDMSWVRC